MTASLSDINAQNVEYNPLLVKWDTPYQTPPFDKIKPVHYLPAFISAISEAKMEVDAIALSKEDPNFENTILALERSGMTLSRISGIFFNILEADANKELQDIAKEVIPLLTNYQNYITLNELLFQRIKQVYDNRHLLQLNTEDAMLLHNTYLNFSRSGANLSPDDKKKYEQLTLELSKLSLEFKDNVLAATNQYYLHITNKADLKGIPATDIEIAAVKAKEKGLKGWVFDLSAQLYGFYEIRRQSRTA